jgi:cytosine/creatinine deaminase
MKCKSDYEKQIREGSKIKGGFYNAHSHGDRAYTFDDLYYPSIQSSVSLFESLSLPEKQNLVWRLHKGPAFEPKCIEDRLTRLLEDSIGFGVTRLNSCIDVTYNTGLTGWEIASDLREKYKDKIDFRLGAYNVSGFKDPCDEMDSEESSNARLRWKYFEEAAKTADFLVALAEKDRKPKHIGEEQHNIYFLNKGLELGIPIHFHVGQENRQTDRGSDLLFRNIRQVYDLQNRLQRKDYPKNFLVHDISASCYDESDFQRHVENLKNFGLGVICCPTAGISMRQDRSLNVPTHNSLARVWDYTLAGVQVMVGTDNVNDVFVPSSNADLFDELMVLSHALRFYNPEIIVKLGVGILFDDFDRANIRKVI